MKKFYNPIASAVNAATQTPLMAVMPSIEELKRAGTNPLRRLLGLFDFESVRPAVERAYERFRDVTYPDAKVRDAVLFFPGGISEPAVPRQPYPVRKSKAGRPHFDPVFMFKVVFLGVMYRLSDNALVNQIAHDPDMEIFLNVSYGFKISRQVVWRYREIFMKADLFKTVTLKHVEELEKSGLISPNAPLIMDGSYIEARVQHNSREENAIIKAGKGKNLWPNNPYKRRQKDIDARWGKKGNVSHYGYKGHPLVEAEHKFVRYTIVTDASVHDSKVVEMMLNEDDSGRAFYGDSAYDSEAIRVRLAELNMTPQICKKGTRGHPLTDADKLKNREKSKKRCRVEHVFGFIENSLRGSFVRTVGIARAAANQWLTVLAYNLCRHEVVTRAARQAC